MACRNLGGHVLLALFPHFGVSSFQTAFCFVISWTSRTKQVLNNKHLLKMTSCLWDQSGWGHLVWGGVYVGGLVMGSFRLKMCASLSIYLLGCGWSLSHMWKVCCCHRNSQYCLVYWFIIESKLAGTPAKTSWTEDGNLYLSPRKEFQSTEHMLKYYRNCINNFHAWLGRAGDYRLVNELLTSRVILRASYRHEELSMITSIVHVAMK